MGIVWDTCEWVEGGTRAGGTGGLPAGGNVEVLEVFRSSPECVGGRGEEVGGGGDKRLEGIA